ncbi:hypothetical protein [Bordetella flabilis]|uniref:Uncharacterized protein n=1 Tax=Bordetella flabilis TaxID=463014 RepID=A0A193G9Z0_9BORD|nr:hypothetical protein [Bordetella flabilis]ANN76807.1 hypothetical protein BAU07_06485 [Bordetella flabilis]
MAIDTYDGLVATMADWLNRGDLSGAIPSFIALFEADFNKDERGRTQRSVAISTALISTPYAPVPVDYIEMLDLSIPNSPHGVHQIELVTIHQLGEYARRERMFPGHDLPKYYAIIGEQMKFLPAPTQEYEFEMVYFAKLPPLSPDNPSNWLLRQSPDVYLYGALQHSAPYLKNDERLATWAALFNQGMEKLNVSDDRAMHSGAPLRMRARGY